MTATTLEINASEHSETATLTALPDSTGTADASYVVTYLAAGVGTIAVDSLTGDWLVETNRGDGTAVRGLASDGVRVAIGNVSSEDSQKEIVKLLESDQRLELVGGELKLKTFERGTATELIPAKDALDIAGQPLADTDSPLGGFAETD